MTLNPLDVAETECVVEAAEEATVQDDTLIEDVSIDGMCGVY